MPLITTKDNTQIFYKDWGSKDAQPIVFHHGWSLSADDWDAQMLFFLAKGYRVVAHDRRCHGRSSQVDTGHDMDHYASDASAVVEHLNLKNAIHIGHSTGGGEVVRYVAKYGEPHGRVAKAVLLASVPPLMVKTEKNPAARQSKCSTASAKRWLRTGRSFSLICRLVRFTALTDRRAGVAGNHSELVASGNDRQRTRPLRRHQGFFRDRPNGRSKSDHRADIRHARRRRPGRAVRERLIAPGQAAKE